MVVPKENLNVWDRYIHDRNVDVDSFQNDDEIFLIPDGSGPLLIRVP